MKILKDLLGEIRSFISGSTFDAVLPPLIFLIINNLYSLTYAIVIALLTAFILFLVRVRKKDKWYYAVGGFLAVVMASAFALIAGQAKNFLLPDLIGNGLILLACLTSLVFNRPLAAWLSHLTRGWQIKWYWREDILPAYREATLMWLVFFLLRLIFLSILFINNQTSLLFLANIVLGFPFTLFVLTLTYVYGILRLRHLGGPSVDEFINQSPQPWQGQRKGF